MAGQVDRDQLDTVELEVLEQGTEVVELRAERVQEDDGLSVSDAEVADLGALDGGPVQVIR